MSKSIITGSIVHEVSDGVKKFLFVSDFSDVLPRGFTDIVSLVHRINSDADGREIVLNYDLEECKATCVEIEQLSAEDIVEFGKEHAIAQEYFTNKAVA